jgi:hypothetical protein
VSSILTSIKKNLGLLESYEAFDPDILMYINTVFSTLSQLGVGPENGFQISDKTATWESYLGADPRMNFVQSYMTLKVRLLFDPPATSFAIAAIEKQADELGWRLNVEREGTKWVDPTVM